MRKIIQMAVAVVQSDHHKDAEPSHGEPDVVYVATCNDGTAWYLWGSTNAWHKLPPIPPMTPNEVVDEVMGR